MATNSYTISNASRLLYLTFLSIITTNDNTQKINTYPFNLLANLALLPKYTNVSTSATALNSVAGI